jgi:ketosteroid isomerase-like protein
MFDTVSRPRPSKPAAGTAVSLAPSIDPGPAMRRLSLIAVLLAGCAGARFDAQAEGAKLLQRDAEWAALATEGKDVDRVVSYWSDDAVVIMPGSAIVEGKDAIRGMVSRSFNNPGFKIHWVSEKPEFSPDGKVAFMRGTDDFTLPGKNGAPARTLHLRGVSVWRKDAQGQWLCVMDVSSEGPPAPSP